MGTVTHAVVPEHELVWYRASGEITFEQLMRGAVEVYRNPEFGRNFDSFFDMDDSVLAFDPAGLQGRLPFFEAIGSRVGERRWAIHVHHHESVRSANMIRKMVEELAGEAPGVVLDIRVFLERDQALEWLGISDSVLPQDGGGAEKSSEPSGDG